MKKTRIIVAAVLLVTACSILFAPTKNELISGNIEAMTNVDGDDGDSDVKWEDAYTCLSWSELPGLARDTITNECVKREDISGDKDGKCWRKK